MKHNQHVIDQASGLYTDMYQLSMGLAYFRQGDHHTPACFDYFFRKLPYEGGYVVFCGLGTLLPLLEDLHFSPGDMDWLHRQGWDKDYLEWLENFRFRGTIYSVKEGEVVFPTEPLLRVEGNLPEAQLVETMLLNHLNFQSLIATKAARMRDVAGEHHLSEFGLRRAHGLGGLHASRAAVIGGFDTTSNVYAAKDYELKAVGTMAHSYIQSCKDELTAFRLFTRAHPDNCTFLVDTYDTLESGVPNAITVAKELVEQGHRAKAIRLDSGDLAYLSKTARRMLDEAGLDYVKIVASNQLDEHVIKSLLDQEAPVDMFGVGTSLATGAPDAALDGVYKLSVAGDEPRLKVSESLKKTTLPGRKQVYRYLDEHGLFADDAVALEGEGPPDEMFHPFEPGMHKKLDVSTAAPLLHKVMENGRSFLRGHSLQESADYVGERLSKLPREHKRFDNPHIYKVGISRKLLQLRSELTPSHNA